MSPSLMTSHGDLQPEKMATATGDLLPCDSCPGRGLNVCRQLEHSRRKELLATSRRRCWSKGELLYSEGDRTKSIFKITKGAVALSQLLADGRRQVVSFPLTGDICGASEPDDRHQLTAIALTDVEVCIFDRDGFDAFLLRHADVSRESRSTLQEGLRAMMQHTIVLGRMTAEERLAYFLLEFTAACARRGIETMPVRLPMTRNDIADHLGLTFETVSRTFRALRNLHLIRTFRHVNILILDRQRLENLARGRGTGSAVPSLTGVPPGATFVQTVSRLA